MKNHLLIPYSPLKSLYPFEILTSSPLKYIYKNFDLLIKNNPYQYYDGNIDVLKEYNYAKDIINAVWILVNQNLIYEVIIGSGVVYSIKDWASSCFKNKGLNLEDHLIIDDTFIPEYSILISNPNLIKSLGWETKCNFNNLVDLMMK